MLDIPVAIAMIAAIVGAAVGAMITFVQMDGKVQRLQADRSYLMRRNRVLVDQVYRTGRPPILRGDTRVDLVLDENAETVSWGGDAP